MLAWIESHPSTISLITALLALAVSFGALLISLSQRPEDTTPIIKLVEEEARLTRERNVDAVLQLFTDDGLVRVWGFPGPLSERQPKQSWRGQSWRGKVGEKSLRARYEMIRDNASFPELAHVGIVVTVDPSGNTAKAISSTQGTFKWQENEEQDISTINGEVWTFVKVDGVWKIKDVTFHSPPNR